MSVKEADENLSENSQLALHLTCPICLQLFTEPMSLPCGHIYCWACLQTMGAGLDQLCCPECQAEYQGTKALVKNFKMCSIVETYKSNSENMKSHTNKSEESNASINKDACSVTKKAEIIEEKPESSNYLKDHKGLEQSSVQDYKGKGGFQIGFRSTGQDQDITKGKKEMEEPKFRLASQVTELTLKLEMAQGVLKKEEEWEIEVSTANAQLRERAAKLLEGIMDLFRSYTADVTKVIEKELTPGEASVRRRVSKTSELTERLRKAMLSAESLLTEEDGAVFNQDLNNLQPHIDELISKPTEDVKDDVESKVNPVRACSKMEQMNTELRAGLGEIQRSLRNILNPSEITFDPETVHPNLVLSEDLKTVTFSTTKQPYPSSPQRFSSFLQVLSTQSFYGGEHCWEVELEGTPWIVGVCYSGKLARSGLPSALESSRSSWCLMWFENLLRAFEQSHEVPLKKTTVSRKLEIRLSFKTHRLSFYNVSPSSGKIHVYTFKCNLTEPVHLAYRMMSGQPMARFTICS